MNKFKARWVRFVLLIAIVVGVGACVVQRNPITGNKRAYGYSWEQEKQIGAEADPQIIAQYGLYPDDNLARYVDGIGQKVLANSHLRRPETPPEYRSLEFHFRVLDSPVVNAFALPGGYVYVTRGLLAHLENEAQLAVVLGHEIGHVAGRHASKRAFQSQLGTLGLIGGAIIGQEVLGLPGQDLLSAGGSVAQLLFLSYGRDDERESDKVGVEYAALTGYTAEEGSEFFVTLKRLGDQSGKSIPGFLSTHPDPGEREQRIKELAQQWSTRTSMTLTKRPEYLQRIDGIVYGDDPRQGYTENGIFYHPGLRFEFPVPPGYQVINQPSQVAMVEPNQNAILVFTFARDASSAADAGQKLAGQQGITVRDGGSTSVNGNQAYYVLGDAQTNNQTIRFLVYYIEYRGSVYQMLGYATQQTFSNYERAFRSSMTGFKSVSDPNVLNVQPNRVKIEKVGGGTFANIVSGRLPKGTSAETVAILNQVSLQTSVSPGTELKFIQ